LFEPKWDGLRTIVFRDGDEIVLGSRNEKPMTRYFPELVEALRVSLPPRCVVDGEIVVINADRRLDFDALQNRIHPAASRVNMLAAQTPVSFVAFDLLALDDTDLRPAEQRIRRSALETILTAHPLVHLTPATINRDEAQDWFIRFEGIGCDGIIAKRLDGPYIEDKRVMVKVKHERTADCAVAGFRWHKNGPVVGSLLLGLYDGAGSFHHVGVTASFTDKRRRELVDELTPYREAAAEGHPWEGWIDQVASAEAAGQRLPGAVSRWNAKKDLSFEPLHMGLVCEVAYDHLQGNRFRHATTFKRWRPDRTPESCTYDQMETPVLATIDELLF
jgi:ATP-dependent DNA ligase